MPSSWTQNIYHAVFSTKHRVEILSPEHEDRLYPFIGGILRELRCTPIEINGMPDHVHAFQRCRATSGNSHSSRWDEEGSRGCEEVREIAVQGVVGECPPVKRYQVCSPHGSTRWATEMGEKKPARK